MTNQEIRRKCDDEIFCRGGYTGVKIHRAYPGSSVTCCGHWMRANAVNFALDGVTDEHIEQAGCEKCFGKRRTTVNK
jgi:hypothetical protein